jgi:hypothetical protein
MLYIYFKLKLVLYLTFFLQWKISLFCTQTVMTRYAISIKGQNVFDVHRPTPETSC